MSLSINVGEKYRSQGFPTSAGFQPADYTSYPVGSKKPGIVPQDGLYKRGFDAVSYMSSIGAIKKGGSSPVTVGSAKAYSNVGILSVVDKFFNWLNKAIGE